jgi:hypothetical protein
MMVHELAAKQLCTSKCSCSDGSHSQAEFIGIATFHLFTFLSLLV